ncbi:MAG: substrate-binding domain-containing protein [Dictyoglomaceae bacterium]|nr:substrate-binding domain-containing protein [Dictyoglomaceae bacterium]
MKDIIPKAPYKVITDFLRERIYREYGPGDKIPSENELANMFKVSKLTARKAIDKLVGEGLLVRVQGIGTFVSDLARFNKNSVKAVGVLIMNRFDDRGLSIVGGIVKTLERFYINPIVVDIAQNEERYISHKLKALVNQEISGLIVSPTQTLLEVPIFKKLLSENFPIVFVDRTIEDVDIPTVESDNYLGGVLLGKHFRKNHNVKRALFITQEGFELTSVKDRYEGFKEGLCSDVDIFISEKVETIREIIPQIKKGDYDGIFFCHDPLAIGGLFILWEAGIRLPEDIKVVSFDNRDIAKYALPKLTTVKQNFEAIGEESALFMVKILKGEEVPKRSKIPVELVVRNSCGCEENF